MTRRGESRSERLKVDPATSLQRFEAMVREALNLETSEPCRLLSGFPPKELVPDACTPISEALPDTGAMVRVECGPRAAAAEVPAPKKPRRGNGAKKSAQMSVVRVNACDGGSSR